MDMTHVLIVGYGFCGRYIAEAIKLVSRETKITVTYRGEKPDGDYDAALTFGDVHDFSSVTHLIMTAAPTDLGDPFLAHYGSCDFPALKACQYLSTTVVYGDAGGAWVTEQSDLLGHSERGLRRIAAEQAWMAFGITHSVPVSLLRLAGLYGRGRNALLDLADGSARRSFKNNHVFNRIHGADVGRISACLVDNPTHGALNMADDEPCASHLVVEYAAELLGVAPPPLLHVDDATLSPMARSFWADHKRVDNALVKSLTGALLFPNYEAGLRALKG
jgi:hypothetical protein